MTTFELLSVEVTLLAGALSLAGMTIKGWIKSSQLDELKKVISENKAEGESHIKGLKDDINQLWDKVSKIEVLSTKIEAIEKSVGRIEDAVNRIVR